MDDPEWDAFLEEITTHETYLFRDQNQWDWFRDTFVANSQSDALTGKRDKSLRVWSAASSTGDEAYTAACCIAHRLFEHKSWTIEIIGTDIGIGALRQARTATFRQRAMQRVPEDYRRRFFRHDAAKEEWAAKSPLTDWTQFQQHNLLEPFKSRYFDLIFLKNVLIYFDGDSKARVVKNIVDALKPGGLLVTGPAEGTADLLRDLDKLQSWLYRKS